MIDNDRTALTGRSVFMPDSSPETARPGDQFYWLCQSAQSSIWRLGEVLSHVINSLQTTNSIINNSKKSEWEIDMPVGRVPNASLIMYKKTYNKQDLSRELDEIVLRDIPVAAAYSLVTIIECWTHDLVRCAAVSYPKKIPAKQVVPVHMAFEAQSLEHFFGRCADHLIASWAYASPAEFADKLEATLSIDVKPDPTWYKFVEFKATRDIWIHNRGQANDTYASKAASLARVRAGEFLPLTLDYLWDQYENSIRLVESFEEKLANKYASVARERDIENRRELQDPPSRVDT